MLKVNFKLGRRLVHALSTTMASYKGLQSSVIASGRGHTVSAAPAMATQLVKSSSSFICSKTIEYKPARITAGDNKA